jgi:hypothetical protein
MLFAIVFAFTYPTFSLRYNKMRNHLQSALYAFVLLSLLREEGAKKSLLEILTPKPGHKLVRTGLRKLVHPCSFYWCWITVPQYVLLIYTCLL